MSVHRKESVSIEPRLSGHAKTVVRINSSADLGHRLERFPHSMAPNELAGASARCTRDSCIYKQEWQNIPCEPRRLLEPDGGRPKHRCFRGAFIRDWLECMISISTSPFPCYRLGNFGHERESDPCNLRVNLYLPSSHPFFVCWRHCCQIVIKHKRTYFTFWYLGNYQIYMSWPHRHKITEMWEILTTVYEGNVAALLP